MRTLLSSARNLDGLLVQVVESLHQSGGRLDGVVEAAIKKYLPELKTVMFEVLRANDEDTSRRGPSLFSFQPAESYSFWTDIGPRLAKKVILHVHCEHSLLPVSWLKNGVDSPGRFEIESSVEWVRRLGPFFLGLGRLLGAGSVLSVAFGGSDSIAQPVLEAFKTVPAELFSKGPVLPPDMNPGGDTWDPRKPWCADPRWLADMHEIIREKLGLDPAAELHEHSRRIGLVRVWDRNNSRFLWVHPQFESLYAEC
ncbi:MAG: hypothetical protein KF791_13010 [Verrucomicrobiae bacterium]|nr:hypothetical protein [Verrucomicrobiae bacterium]